MRRVESYGTAALPHALIQRSAWNGYSANFVLLDFSHLAAWQTASLKGSMGTT